jgi:glycerophosphoryl diester phosphodiesterase
MLVRRTTSSFTVLATLVLALAAVQPAVADAADVSGGADVNGTAKGFHRRLRPPCEPLVIAHRGASGYRPEHTLAAYALAIDMGADYVEPDLVMTADGRLVARHDNVLDLTTDVAEHPELTSRRTTKVVDGLTITGCFSEDITLAEIKRLRAVERIPTIRPGNARFDRRFEIPTFSEILDLVRRKEREKGRRIGIYPETKHPTYFAAAGLDINRPLVHALRAHGYRKRSDPVFIQSFEIANLRRLNTMTKLRLVQLLGFGTPPDVAAAGGATTYEQMATPTGLAEIAAYADGVGPDKNHFVIPLGPGGGLHLADATSFVHDAHAAGLEVHPYTFRAENLFLPSNFRIGADPNAPGDLSGEIKVFLAAGVDGFFTDQPDIGVRAKRSIESEHHPRPCRHADRPDDRGQPNVETRPSPSSPTVTAPLRPLPAPGADPRGRIRSRKSRVV